MTNFPPETQRSVDRQSQNPVGLVQDVAQRIVQSVSQVIIGKRNEIRLTVLGLISQGHILIEDIPGVGKTMLAKALSRSIGCTFSRIQFTPDMLPSDVTGVSLFNQKTREFEFRAGPIMAQIILADEINRATPKTQAALLEAMEERQVTVDGVTYPMENPFLILATQNPIEYEGTFPLPEAQLDRFMFKVNVGFPQLDELVNILERTTGAEAATPGKVADGKQVISMGKLALSTPVASHLNEYVARLIVATHPEHPTSTEMVRQYIRYGSSPRGAQALIIGAKVNALLEGRFNVSFEDIQAVAPAALRHRLLMNFEGLAEGISTDEIVKDVLNATRRQPA